MLVIAALVASAIIWASPIDRLMTVIPALWPAAPLATLDTDTPSISPLNISPLNINVDEARLMAHVVAIAQPRYTDSQKETARSYIITKLTDFGLAPVEQRYDPAESGSSLLSGVNIVAELPGRDPRAGAIVLGAHYDTTPTSPGADDNGSAIATLLEVARLFSAQSAAGQPALATLKLVFFDQEEQQSDGSGLLGSLAFAQDANNTVGVRGAVILDMVGYACHTEGCQTYPMRLPLPDLPDTGDFLAVLGLQSQRGLIDTFVRSAQGSGPRVFSLPIPEPTLKLFPDLLRSDHAPFWEKDIPAIFVSDTANFRNPNYHTSQDTPDTLDLPFLKGSAQHIVDAIAALLQASP